MFQRGRPMLYNYNDIDHITENIYLGNINAAGNYQLLKRLGITHILTVAAGLNPPFTKDFKYKVIEVLDMPAVNLGKFFSDAVDFISLGNSYGKVFVHCFAGISRSSSCIIAFLMQERGMSYGKALAFVKLKRPIVCPNIGFQKQLMDYENKIKNEKYGLNVNSGGSSKNGSIIEPYQSKQERSHSLATTFQLRQQELKKQQEAKEEVTSEIPTPQVSQEEQKKPPSFFAKLPSENSTQNNFNFTSIPSKPKTSTSVIQPRNEGQMRFGTLNQKNDLFGISGTSFAAQSKQQANLQQQPEPVKQEQSKPLTMDEIKKLYSHVPFQSQDNKRNVDLPGLKTNIHPTQATTDNHLPDIINTQSQASFSKYSASQSQTPSKQLQIKKYNENEAQFSCAKCSTQLFKNLDIIDHTPINQLINSKQQNNHLAALGIQRLNLLSQGSKGLPNKNVNSLISTNPIIGSSEQISCTEFYIQRKDWIMHSEGHFGTIYCPKRSCHQKIGVYSTLGLKCTCGKQINPGYLIYKSKCNKNQNQ